jgi:hypothetical protein
MLARPTEEDFKRHEGTKFLVRVEAPRPLELELTQVKSYNPQASENNNMERFSLFFDGPADMFLQQGLYPLEHPEMGEMQLFMVPIGRGEHGFQYEVVFNYFKNK